MLTYVIAGKTGGARHPAGSRQACGVSRSRRSVAGLEARQEDVGFDLRARFSVRFCGMKTRAAVGYAKGRAARVIEEKSTSTAREAGARS